MIKFLLFLTFSLSSQACILSTSGTIYTYSSENTISLESKGCSNNDLNTIKEILSDSEGTINEDQLLRISGLKKLSLRPSSVRVTKLENIMHQRLKLSSKIKLEVLNHGIPTDFFNLKNDEFLKISCAKCSRAGIKNAKITKSNGTTHKTIWIKTKVLKAINGLVSITRVNLDFDGIRPQSFVRKLVYTLTPEDAIDDSINLAFYRLNSSIEEGLLLKRSQITPIQLVRYGSPTRVIISSKTLKMTTTARSLSSGKYGDTIKLKNMKSNKVFLGTIIDKNTVKVAL